ncbi:diguanylate cyclase [Nocardioides sp. NPDC051685]|uniref:diguanylate cyclase n=1 Tax=Nocardioides sp. NPDC051685 TaxID=3364334 RepID=UPI0037B3A699
MTARSDSSGSAFSQARARLDELAARARVSLAESLATIEAAVRVLEAGALDEETERQAERAAHRIAGTAGTVGLPDATEPARAIEQAFAGHARADDARRMARHVAELRRALAPADTESFTAAASHPTSRLLAIHAAPSLAARMGSVATSHGLAVTEDRAEENVEAAIVDLDVPDAEAIIQRCGAARPAVPVVVLAETTSVTDRLRAANAGAHLVLPRDGPAAEPIEAVTSLLGQRHHDRLRVLAVDDDPLNLALLRETLATEPVEVSTLEDPRTFWGTLERERPDLVVLDVDMPHLDGMELCRTIRTDPRWSGLPVLFLTASTGPAAVDAVFAAGADDYVPKPFNPSELRARIRNRLERAEMYRRLADTDPLTGVANRRRLERDFHRLCGLARRHNQRLSLALLDIDHFKSVNDTHGHGVGDQVLVRLTDHLTAEFRGEDVVARLGGDEVALLAFGMSAADAQRRLTSVLGSPGLVISPPEAQEPLTIRVSAGVADVDVHDDTLETALRTADAALYDAKRSGRARVGIANRESHQHEPATAAGGKASLHIDPAVRDYYATMVERERLEITGHGRLERLRTQELLTRMLPPAPARILDVGGGTGVHARWLANAGHEVHLIDIVPEHVVEALSHGSAFTAALGDARQLDEPDDSADAVLLLGPLYHLLIRTERVQALREAQRVLRPGGTLAASVVSRHAALLAYATRAEQDAERLDLAINTVAHGGYDPKLGFTTAYFHTPDEIASELHAAGFREVRVLPIEGPLWTSVKTCTDPLHLDRLTESAVLCARALEDDAAMLPASAHLLAIGHA